MNVALEAPAKGADPEFDRQLGDSKWAGDPLYLMMAGLEAAKLGVREALMLPRGELAISRARFELDRVGRMGASRGIEDRRTPSGFFVRHMAVSATLLQGMKEDDALLLAHDECSAIFSKASPGETIDVLKDALPGSKVCDDGTPVQRSSFDDIAPIRPDAVGEAAILEWFGGTKGTKSHVPNAEARILNIANVTPSRGDCNTSTRRRRFRFRRHWRAVPLDDAGGEHVRR